MNITAVLAALVQMGACAPTHFQGSDGSQLTVLVCPSLQPSEASKDPEPQAEKPAGKDL